MQNTVRWCSAQFQPTHILNPWSNETDVNLEDSACTVLVLLLFPIHSLQYSPRIQNNPHFKGMRLGLISSQGALDWCMFKDPHVYSFHHCIPRGWNRYLKLLVFLRFSMVSKFSKIPVSYKLMLSVCYGAVMR